jgi:hypothetical protein
MKIFHLLFFWLVCSYFLSAQEKQYPEAIPTDQANVVISPYDDTRRLDIAGLKPGSLAEDPVAEKIFRVPGSSPVGVDVPPIDSIPPPPTDASTSPSAPLPTDLLNFIYAFNQNSPSEDNQKQAPGETVYSKFEIDQISLFLEAFAASGGINEPSAMVDFIHPQISEFNSMRRPLTTDVLEVRSDYIRRWPERRYWLTEKPGITRISSGSWDVVLKMDFEEKNGTQTNKGVRVSDLRITHTQTGLKIASMKNRQ